MRFADEINLLRGSEEELQQLAERLEKTVDWYCMESSSDKRKILVKPRFSANIWMNGKTLEEVAKFKYLGSTQTKDRTPIKEVKKRSD